MHRFFTGAADSIQQGKVRPGTSTELGRCLFRFELRNSPVAMQHKEATLPRPLPQTAFLPQEAFKDPAPILGPVTPRLLQRAFIQGETRESDDGVVDDRQSDWVILVLEVQVSQKGKGTTVQRLDFSPRIVSTYVR